MIDGDVDDDRYYCCMCLFDDDDDDDDDDGESIGNNRIAVAVNAADSEICLSRFQM